MVKFKFSAYLDDFYIEKVEKTHQGYRNFKFLRASVQSNKVSFETMRVNHNHNLQKCNNNS
jgi:hypothetical protein